jgi:nitrogen fixation protein FixH
MARPRAPGWWYPWIFVVGMLLVIVVNVGMAAYAIGTFPGLETEDAYRKGLAYNETIAAARAQDQRGWRIDLRFTPSADPSGHGGDLGVAIVDRTGDPVRGLEVKADLIRPTRAGADMSLMLGERAAGLYGAAIAAPLPGQWDARIVARRGQDEFQTTRRIIVP